MKRSLKPRERVLVAIAAAVVAVAVLIPLYNGVSERYEDSVAELREIGQRHRSAIMLREIVQTARRDRGKYSDIFDDQEQGDFYELVRETLTATNLDDRAELRTGGRLRASGNRQVIEVTLERFAMDDFLDFLHGLYSRNGLIIVQRMDYLRPGKKGAGLECSIMLSAPESRS